MNRHEGFYNLGTLRLTFLHHQRPRESREPAERSAIVHDLIARNLPVHIYHDAVIA